MTIKSIRLKIRETYGSLPPAVPVFFIRVFVLILIWTVGYRIFLRPLEIPDRWLTNLTSSATAKLLTFWYHPTTFTEFLYGTKIIMNNRVILTIAHACNALELFVLYAGFIFCIPTNTKRLILFVLIGILTIFLLNVLRCNILIWLACNNVKVSLFNMAHHYVFNFIVYAFIFYGWILYLKDYGNK